MVPITESPTGEQVVGTGTWWYPISRFAFSNKAFSVGGPRGIGTSETMLQLQIWSTAANTYTLTLQDDSPGGALYVRKGFSNYIHRRSLVLSLFRKVTGWSLSQQRAKPNCIQQGRHCEMLWCGSGWIKRSWGQNTSGKPLEQYHPRSETLSQHFSPVVELGGISRSLQEGQIICNFAKGIVGNSPQPSNLPKRKDCHFKMSLHG
jgi:hypothetical protein